MPKSTGGEQLKHVSTVMRTPVRKQILLVLLSAVGLLLVLVLPTIVDSSPPVVINGTAIPPLPTLNPLAIAAGEQIYAQTCASCHGANLEGAPDWKVRLPDGSLPPPPQGSSGHTWHHADSLLSAIIRNGGDPTANSKMPAFGKQLRDEDIAAILAFFKSRWGEEERKFQWWVTVAGAEQ